MGTPVVTYTMLEDIKDDAYSKIVEFVVINWVGKIVERATNLRMQLPSNFASAVRLKFVNVATACEASAIPKFSSGQYEAESCMQVLLESCNEFPHDAKTALPQFSMDIETLAPK